MSLLKNKKALAMSVLCAIASVGFVVSASAEETMHGQLEEVVVEGSGDVLPGGFVKEKAQVGLMGKQEVMNAPMTISEFSNKTLTTFAAPNTGLSDALSLDPSVRADRGGTYTDLTIRGIYQSGHAYYVNGIPGLLCQENIPYYWADSASVISGPNLGVNATAFSEAAAGSVNLQSKVASSEGNSNVKISYLGGSSMEEALDVGRRFGDNDQFGVRVTASNISGDTAIDGENLERQAFSLNLDQKSEKSNSNLLIAYDHTDHKGGMGAFSFGKGVTSLPDAPDASQIYKPDWSYNEYDNWMVALNHEQKLSECVNAYLNAGYHREDWYGYVDGNPTIINNQGDFTISMTNYPLALTKKYVGAGIKGDFNIGSVKNEYLIGADKTWYDYNLSQNNDYANNGKWEGTGNIHQNNWWPSLPRPSYDPAASQTAQMTGWHIVDNLKALDDKLSVTLGLHGHKATKNPVGKTSEESDAICPTIAVSYQVSPVVTVYADHSESFGMGSMVSTNKGYKNAGEMLDPAKTKQDEIGVKVKTGNFMNTFSAFKITQANNVDKYINGDKYLVQDGEQENKGFEWGFTGNLSDKWDLIGGAMYLDAKDNKGNRIDGAAEWSASVGAIYHPNDDLSLIGRMTYLGSSTIKSGALDVPSYAKFDLGASYKTKWNNTHVSLDLMCYNLGGKDYWNARSGSSSLSLGAPRTVVLSANFEI